MINQKLQIGELVLARVDKYKRPFFANYQLAIVVSRDDKRLKVFLFPDTKVRFEYDADSVIRIVPADMFIPNQQVRDWMDAITPRMEAPLQC